MDQKKITVIDPLPKQSQGLQQENANFLSQIENDVVSPKDVVLQTQQMFTEQEIIDNPENTLKKPQQQNQSTQAAAKKKKLIIIVVVVIVVLIILGILLGVLLSRHSSSSSSSETESHSQKTDFFEDKNSKIKFPQRAKELKETILAGQNDNVVKLVYVPNTLKVYEYTISSNSTVISGDGSQTVQKSKVVHTFGLLCSSITDKEFELYLYFMDSKTYDDGNLVNSLTGYPNLLNGPNGRFLDQSNIDFEANNKRNTQSTDDESDGIENEYGALSDEDLQILESKGISEEDFFASSFPIIQFKLQKDGQISRVMLPVNMRYDLLKIYLSVLDQVSPILKSDYYKVDKKNSNNGGRILFERQQQYKERTLASEEIEPTLTAEVESETGAKLTKQFTENLSESDDKVQENQYNQNQQIESGALLESKAEAQTNLEDKSNVTVENGGPMMKKMDVKSSTVMTFIKQDDDVSKEFMDQLVNVFNSMTFFNQTYSEAKDTFKVMFPRYKVSGEANESTQSDDSVDAGRRLLGQKVRLGPPKEYELFSKSIFGKEFGASMVSECFKGRSLSENDFCSLSIVSKVEGNKKTLYSKTAEFNVSKVLKMIQFIQSFVVKTFNNIEYDLKTRQPTLIQNVNSMLDSVESVLNTSKNTDTLKFIQIIQQAERNSTDFTTLYQSQINQVAFKIQNTYSLLFNDLHQLTSSYLYQRLDYFKQSFDKFEAQASDNLNKIDNLLKTIKQIDQDTYNHITDIVSGLIYYEQKKIISPFENIIQKIQKMSIDQTLSFVKAFMTQSNGIRTQYKAIVEPQIFNLLTRMLTGDIELIVQNYWQRVIGITENIAVFKNERQSLFEKNLNTLKDSIQQKLQKIEKVEKSDSSEVKEIRQSVFKIYSLQSEKLNIQKDLAKTIQGLQISFDTINEITTNTILPLQNTVAQQMSDFQNQYAKKVQDCSNIVQVESKKFYDNVKVKIDQLQKTFEEFSTNIKSSPNSLISELKAAFAGKNYPADHESYDKEQPLFNDIFSISSKFDNLLKQDFTGVKAAQERFARISGVSSNFLSQFQPLIDSQMSKLPNPTLNLKGVIPGSGQITVKKVTVTLLTQIPSELTQKLTSNDSFLQKNYAVLVQNINDYKTQISDQVSYVSKNYQTIFIEAIKKANFEKVFPFPIEPMGFRYDLYVPTPVILIQFTLKAEWKAGVNFKVSLKEGEVGISTGVTSAVVLTGEVSASVVIARAGGYVRGTFLNAGLDLGFKLNFFSKNSKIGALVLTGTFQPYKVEFGLFYEHPTISMGCRRNLWGWLKSVGKAICKGAKAVNNFTKKVGNTIANVAVKVFNCLKSIRVSYQRHEDQYYSKELFRVDF